MSSISRSTALSTYEVVTEIGRGGMADVFLAVRRDAGPLDPRVVIKRLREDLAEEADFRAMFLDEARLAMQLVHPNVVRTFEVGTEDRRCFIAMEFLDGQPLSRLRKRGWQLGSLPLDVQLRILCDALAGLDYVHGVTDRDGTPLGIVHRDVTPSNVFVSYGGLVKVVDFGIAVAATRLADTTRIGVVKGKIPYMAPEHARGDGVDRRSDIFSVGIMLWEAVSGRRFWQGHDELAIYRRLIAGDLPTADPVDRPSVPALAEILARAIAVDVEWRFQTAAEMREAIEDVLRQMDSRVDSAAVGRSVSLLFARERVAFRAAVQAELLRLKAGQRATALAFPNGGAPERATSDTEDAPSSSPPSSGVGTRIVRKPIESARQHGVTVAPVEVRTDLADLRPRSGAWLAAASLAIGVVIGFASWLAFRSSTTSTASPAISEARGEPIARTTAALAPATPVAAADSLTARAAPSARVVVAPAVTPAKVWRPPVAAPIVRAPARPQLPPTSDELRRTPRARRALDQEDPWSE